MALIFNQDTVASAAPQAGVARQTLLDNQRVKDIDFRLERIVLRASASQVIRIPTADLAWFQILEGDAVLVHGGERDAISHAHVVFLPPSFDGVIESHTGAVFLFAEIAGAKRLDPDFGRNPLAINIIDWTHEPVLLSEHDARKRIYLATPTLSGTKALKGEMIIYPPGTEAANHHHEGAAHFMYILAGAGTVFADETPHRVREGDVVYYADRERHYLRSDPDVEMRFVEFFVPGQYKTIWAEGANVCTWNPAGCDIRGNKASREIQAHSSAAPTSDI
jgi:quercetin dioxygenase-like cupin family protein